MIEDDEIFFEMTNLVKSHTGLPCIIWLSFKSPGQKAKILVQADYSQKLRKDLLFSITISNKPEISGDTANLSPEDLEQLKNFVILNREVLMDFWNEVDPNILSIIDRLRKT